MNFFCFEKASIDFSSGADAGPSSSAVTRPDSIAPTSQTAASSDSRIPETVKNFFVRLVSVIMDSGDAKQFIQEIHQVLPQQVIGNERRRNAEYRQLR